MKAIDRLYEYFSKKNLKPTAVEKEIGISNGYLSSQKKRSADMGEGILNKIIDYFQDINPIWLITGNGPMLKDDNTGYGLPDKEPSIVAESSSIAAACSAAPEDSTCAPPETCPEPIFTCSVAFVIEESAALSSFEILIIDSSIGLKSP